MTLWDEKQLIVTSCLRNQLSQLCVCVCVWVERERELPHYSLHSRCHSTSRTKGKAAKMAHTHTHRQRSNRTKQAISYLSTKFSICPSRTFNWFTLSLPSSPPFCLSVCLVYSLSFSLCPLTRTLFTHLSTRKKEERVKAVSVCQLVCVFVSSCLLSS
jgi:hypothetical protein